MSDGLIPEDSVGQGGQVPPSEALKQVSVPSWCGPTLRCSLLAGVVCPGGSLAEGFPFALVPVSAGCTFGVEGGGELWEPP